jgi:hypothetical protein
MLSLAAEDHIVTNALSPRARPRAGSHADGGQKEPLVEVVLLLRQAQVAGQLGRLPPWAGGAGIFSAPCGPPATPEQL